MVGRYVLYGELASGGMATVHFGRLAGPVGFSRTVAIKRLHPHFAKDPEFVSMFLDEARLCGRIRHPNVVPTLDVVTTHGEVFLVMEYVAGEALSRLIRSASEQRLRVPRRVAATIVSSVLHGLHAAHQAKDEHGQDLGIVHRDVSPQNILVGADGAARVLDFGVAKAAGRLQTTRDGQLKGKIAYMPPEQLAGATVTKQVDIYAASVVLWETLTGRRLFDGETEAIVLARAIEGSIEPPSHYNPELDPGTDAVVLRGLSRDPAQRYATAREMALAIEQYFGLASPSEVGAWVESTAGPELARRARTVAEIEVASLESARMRVSLDPSEPHSQVSSISVSRPAVSVPPARRHGGAKAFMTVSALLALAGGSLGVFTARQHLGPARHASPRQQAPEGKRAYERVPPLAVTQRATEPTRDTAVRVAPPPAAPVPKKPPPPAPPPPQANPCDPPFTIDASGHRTYKRECLK
jgi:eukaryotic-like serine/threonine-protein kinase